MFETCGFTNNPYFICFKWRLKRKHSSAKCVIRATEIRRMEIRLKRNKNIQDLVGGHLMKDEKVAKKKLEKRQGKSKTCNTTRSALCCMQVVNTNTSRNNQTKEFSAYTIPLHANVNGLFTY